MFYSIGARGATRQAVMDDLSAQLDEVVKAHPIHSVDRDNVQLAAQGFLDAVTENDDGKDFHIKVSGDLVWNGDKDNQVVHQTSVSINVSLVTR